MKVRISLPDEDVDFLNDDAERLGMTSRSAVLQEAVRLLRATELGTAYAEAWDEWASDPSNDSWDESSSDGLIATRRRS